LDEDEHEHLQIAFRHINFATYEVIHVCAKFVVGERKLKTYLSEAKVSRNHSKIVCVSCLADKMEAEINHFESFYQNIFVGISI
jgi:hypothetical protein